ncbi:MAG: MaoC family dehydratase N-terminal domain-containing protein [Betaproteobacteria bacterium]
MAQNLEKLKDWIGERETDVDYVTIPSVHRLAATLDRDDPMPKNGDPLPPGWHTLLFPRVVRQSQVGHDGHPTRGDFLPPVPLPRRMNAGRRTWLIAPLRIGDEVKKEASIKDVVIKQGRTGQMVFVTVKTDILSPRGLAITDEMDVVYREEPAPDAPQAAAKTPPANAAWTKVFNPDPVVLFRYSALTFNGHRIHYDYPYVTQKEGYPGLVQNGGLTNLLLFELARTHAKTPVKYLAARNMRPMFADQPFTLCGAPSADGKSAQLWTVDATGAQATDATVEFQ